ncbi:MAG: hypothetical protein AB8B55_15345 [Mariniblastus sp.]
MQFFYVYKSIEHPEVNNYISVFNLKERLKHIEVAKDRFKTEIPWICDTMENDVKIAFGNAPNGEFILDPNGKLIRKRFWSIPETLRADLAELVGPSESVTKVSDLETAFEPNIRKAASGIVPRLKLPRGLRPLINQPVPDDKHPFYAKLRAEGISGQEGTGLLYLGVFLDPIYEVHWNNLAGKVKIEISSNGAKLEKTELIGPDVKEDSDIDPREFLIKTEGLEKKSEFDITLTYTVCDDAETFCTEIKQQYKVLAQYDRHLGSRPGIFMNEIFFEVRKFDKNGDGDLTADELPPGQTTVYIGHMDYDGNGIIESKEIDRFLSMFDNGRGISRHNDGFQEAIRPPSKN